MIGILALQGAFREHEKVLQALGQRTVLVKKPSHLEAIDGLVIPGGESTAISLLIDKYGLKEPLMKFVAGHPVLATCAGLILLAKEVKDGKVCLPSLDIAVRRNAFGRQIDSFEEDLDVSVLGKAPFPAIFIRAPWIEEVGKEVEVLAQFGQFPGKLAEKKIVAVKQGKIIGLAFHPELTKDTRFHQHFISMIKSRTPNSELT